MVRGKREDFLAMLCLALTGELPQKREPVPYDPNVLKALADGNPS